MTHEKNMIDYLDFAESKDSDIGLDEKGNFNYEIFYDTIMAKKDFNKSQPKLGDFVPTNEDGEVMEKPDPEDYQSYDTLLEETNRILYKGLSYAYQEALDRCLWKDWEIKEGHLFSDNCCDYIGSYIDNEFRFTKPTYEQLITSGVKLERKQKK